ncbi:high mobility group B protein 4-like [Thrips palmi]|uniref:High mobility group B protein 4-like n=1 Tax=Thrips palmi TaxID=161013 RepID=A0A6P8ZSW6_THRPL|nr:high mobility group B protein 4-like [Thrips palmi]
MTVIRAPLDDEDEGVGEGEAGVVEQTEAKQSVTKAVGRSIKYIRRVLGLKNKRRTRKKLRAPPGFKATRNPFFNFLRHLQVELQGMSAAEVAREGGRRWRHMSDRDKQPYRQMAQRASRQDLTATHRERQPHGRIPCATQQEQKQEQEPGQEKQEQDKEQDDHRKESLPC